MQKAKDQGVFLVLAIMSGKGYFQSDIMHFHPSVR